MGKENQQFLVDAGKVHKLRARAVKFRESIFTHIYGTLIKEFLEELDLWEEKEP